MIFSQEQFESAFEKSPDTLKESVLSAHNFEILKSIHENKKLTQEQSNNLADEIAYVLTGLNRPEDFLRNISERLKIDTNLVRDIGNEVSAKIFSPVKEELRILAMNKEGQARFGKSIDEMKKQVAEEDSEKKKTLAEELEETVGVTKPKKFFNQVEQVKTFDRDIKIAQGETPPEPHIDIHPETPLVQMMQEPKPVPPAPKLENVKPPEPRETPKPPRPESDVKLDWQSGASSSYDQQRNTSPAPEEEKLDRDALLRAIEDPSTIEAAAPAPKPAPRPSIPPAPKPMQNIPQEGYSKDPYREPIE